MRLLLTHKPITMKISICTLFILSSLFIWSCDESTDVSTPETESELLDNIDGLWRLQSGVFVTNEEVPVNPLAYLEFQSADRSISGFSSRNELSGEFAAMDRSGITISLENVTDALEDAWSSQFLDLTQKAEQFELSGDTLLLSSSTFSAPLEFLRLSDSTCVLAKNDEEAFDRADSDDFFLKDIQLINQCLEVFIAYGGGCGSVDMRLVGNSAYAESLPPQLGVRLLFEDNDNCEALIERRFYFDLTELQYPGLDRLQLRLIDWDENILVEYGN
jgi:heat shock protein HslJ